MALAYLVLIGSILSYGAYVFALSKLPSTVVSLYAYVNPVIAVFLGWLILDEQFGFNTILAMTVTLLGVYMVNAGFKMKTTRGRSILEVFLYAFQFKGEDPRELMENKAY